MKPLRPIPPLAACILLVVVTLGVYWSAKWHEFVDYDDGDYVTGNTQVLKGLTGEGVKWAFTTGHASNWHPLTWLSHELDVTLFGKEAGGHHLTSLLLHCINSALVFFVVRLLTGASWRSFFVAAFFALHPLHVESVAWVSERKDVLSSLFALLTIWAYAKYANLTTVKPPPLPQSGKEKGERTGSIGLATQSSSPDVTMRGLYWYLLTLLVFVLGLLSKPMLVTLPLVLLLLDYWPLQRIKSGTRPWLEKIPFLVLAAISSCVTFVVQRKGGAVSPLQGLPVGARVENALISYVRYLKKTFWPDDLSVLYPHPGNWGLSLTVGAALLLAGITVAAVLLRKRYPFFMVGWFWFGGMLVPVIGLVQVGIQSMADRYTYLPSIGLFIAIVWGVAACVERWPTLRPIAALGGAIAVCACAALTAVQVGIWKNTETLFQHAVEVTKGNYLAYNNLGFYFANHNRMDEAITNYMASLKINPNYADANNNLGHALAERKQFAEAIQYYRAGLRADPNSPEIHNNLGNALAETGQGDAAMAEYRAVLQKNPKHADAHNNLGIALAMRGQLPEAMEHFNLALQYKPNDAGAHGNLGNAFAAQKKWDQAIEHYRAALTLSSNDAQTWNNLGNVLAEQGRFNEAVTNYAEALRLKADNPEAEFNLAYTLIRLGRMAEAKEHLRKALLLKPDYTAAQDQLQRLNAQP